MNDLSFKQLRQANNARAIEWNPSFQPVSREFALIELCGEVGELANAIKKRLRFEMGLKGGVGDPNPTIEELADVAICLDLLASKLGVDLGSAVVTKFNATSVKHGFVTRLPGGAA